MPVWFKVFVSILLALQTTTAAGFGLWLLIDTIRFSRRAIRVTGMVVRIHSQWEERTRHEDTGSHRERVEVHYPVIAFKDAEGVEHEVQAKLGNTCTPAYRVGESVPILFRPDDPQSMRINSFVSMYGVMSAMFFMAVVGAAVFTGFSLYW